MRGWATIAAMPRFPEVAESSVGLSDAVFSKLVARARERGGKTYPLHVGDTYLEPYEGARAEAIRSVDHHRLHNYAPVQGEPALLDAILAHVERRSGARLDRELVQVVSGATAGIAVVVDALLSPGDELLLLAPFWPLVRGTTQRRGGRAMEVPFWDRLAPRSRPTSSPSSRRARRPSTSTRRTTRLAGCCGTCTSTRSPRWRSDTASG
jgi:N-succinyldiaminopimelate aminotransferase